MTTGETTRTSTANMIPADAHDFRCEHALDSSLIPESERATCLGLEDVLPLLACPRTHEGLELARDSGQLVAGDLRYQIHEGLPILLPPELHPFLVNGRLEIPHSKFETPFLHYFLLSAIKQNQGEVNSPVDNVWRLRHQFRTWVMLRGARGTVLDIGCDSPSISSAVFPPQARYVGLDVLFQDTSEFRVIGTAECLPARDASFDNVCLQTSLDHVLDQHTAIEEAWRVLKPGGMLYLSTLVWLERADLLRDVNHFHHFREEEILFLLRRFNIEYSNKYVWKDDSHRQTLYLAARK